MADQALQELEMLCAEAKEGTAVTWNDAIREINSKLPNVEQIIRHDVSADYD